MEGHECAWLSPHTVACAHSLENPAQIINSVNRQSTLNIDQNASMSTLLFFTGEKKKSHCTCSAGEMLATKKVLLFPQRDSRRSQVNEELRYDTNFPFDLPELRFVNICNNIAATLFRLSTISLLSLECDVANACITVCQGDGYRVITSKFGCSSLIEHITRIMKNS